MSEISSAVKDCSNTLDVKDSNSSDSTAHFEKRFHRLSEDNLFSDCEFVVGPQNVVIKGHKAIFAVASEVFQAMFYGGFKENKTIEIEDLDPEGFTGMKSFIYTGVIHFTSAIHALQTYNCARKYLISPLTKLCVEYVLSMKPSEVLEVYEYCKPFNISEFDEACYKMIRERTDEVIESEHFLESAVDTIELILQSPSLRLTSEVEVFVHFERWTHAERDRMIASGISDEKMMSVFNRLKKHIRFLTMSQEEFLSKAEESSLLTIEEKHAILISQLRNGSKPLPETISMSMTKRNFLPSKSDKYYPYKFQMKAYILPEPEEDDSCIIDGNAVVLPLTSDNTQKLHSQLLINLQHQLFITMKNYNVCFLLTPPIRGAANQHLDVLDVDQLTLFLKSKLVVKNKNGGDDMTFEKRSRITIKVGSNAEDNQQGAIMAEVPLNELLPLRNDDNIVIIEVSYNFIDKSLVDVLGQIGVLKF